MMIEICVCILVCVQNVFHRFVCQPYSRFTFNLNPFNLESHSSGRLYILCFHSLDLPSANVWDMRIVMVFVCVYVSLYKRDACGFHNFRSSHIFCHSHFFSICNQMRWSPSLFNRHITNWIFQFDTLYVLYRAIQWVELASLYPKLFLFARRGDVLLLLL